LSLTVNSNVHPQAFWSVVQLKR